MSAAILNEIVTLLKRGRTASLATADDTGNPHAANVQYVSDSRANLWFVSSGESAHGRHIAARPTVALTVYDHDDLKPENLRGIQMHGHCEAVTAQSAWQRAWSLYIAKFAFVGEDPRMAELVKAQHLYRVTPTWIRWIDNRQGFGTKQEISVDNDLEILR